MTQSQASDSHDKAPLSSTQAAKPASNSTDDKAAERGYQFMCKCCGIPWEHKVKNTSGLCRTCVEIRRGLFAFINKGIVTKKEMNTRVQKLLAD